MPITFPITIDSKIISLVDLSLHLRTGLHQYSGIYEEGESLINRYLLDQPVQKPRDLIPKDVVQHFMRRLSIREDGNVFNSINGSIKCGWFGSAALFLRRGVLIHCLIDAKLPDGPASRLSYRRVVPIQDCNLTVMVKAKRAAKNGFTEVMVQMKGRLLPPFASLQCILEAFYHQIGFQIPKPSFVSFKVTILTNYALNKNPVQEGDRLVIAYSPLKYPCQQSIPEFEIQDYFHLCLRQYVSFLLGRKYVQAIPELRIDVTSMPEKFAQLACACEEEANCQGLAAFLEVPPCPNMFATSRPRQSPDDRDVIRITQMGKN